MERWQKAVAVVTGASAGIGAAISINLTKSGMIVIGLARRVEAIEALKSEIPEKFHRNLHALKCDVSKEEEIIECFKVIEQKFGAISVLINNAGTSIRSSLLKNEDSEKLRKTMDVNVFGLVFCTREAYKSMHKHGIDGHIVHINSIAGHQVLSLLNLDVDYEYNIYSASKFAVTALTEIYRQDFIKKNNKIKVTSISPGITNTAMVFENLQGWLEKSPHLQPKDVADAVIYVLGTPPHVQITELTIRPVGEMV